jgi:hypothetical protein
MLLKNDSIRIAVKKNIILPSKVLLPRIFVLPKFIPVSVESPSLMVMIKIVGYEIVGLKKSIVSKIGMASRRGSNTKPVLMFDLEQISTSRR